MTIVLSSPNTTAASTSAPGEPIVMSGKATRMARTIALATKDQKRDSTRHTVARFYAAAFAVALAAVVALAPPAVAAADPATQLADRYAPVVRVVAQEKECGHGEPYEPIDVNAVLRQPGRRAPRGVGRRTDRRGRPDRRRSRQGAHRLPPGLPGQRARPGLRLREVVAARSRRARSRRRMPASSPTPTTPGKLALQYWFFYAFNDWNNTHEGDWEMIQLDFDASDAAAALKTDPYEVGYSQHTGGERAAWGSSKLKLVDGTHPSCTRRSARTRTTTRPSLFLGRSGPRASAATTRSARRATSAPSSRSCRPRRMRTCRRTRGSGSSGTGERSTAASTTARPGRTRSRSGRARSHGPTPRGGTTPTRSPAAGRSARRRPTSSAAPSRGGRTSSRPRSPTRPGSSSRSALSSCCCSGSARGRAGTSRRRSGSAGGGRGGRSSPRRSASTGRGSGSSSASASCSCRSASSSPWSSTCSSASAGSRRSTDSAGASNAFVAALALALGLFFTIIGLTLVQAVTALAMVELDEGHDVGPLDAYRLVLPRLAPSDRRAPARRGRDRRPRPHGRRACSSASGCSSGGC